MTAITDEQLYCANPNCDSPLAPAAVRCTRCHEAQLFCRQCGANARILARFCRICAQALGNNWSLEHPGSRFRPPTSVTINDQSLFQLDWQLDLATEMLATPLAARGLIILTIVSGHILILDELDGQVRTELAAQAPLSFTPVMLDHLLVVGTGEGIIAFDLIAALYGNIAKGSLRAWQYPLAANEQIIKPLLSTPEAILAVVKRSSQTRLLIIDKITGQLKSDLPLDARGAKTTNLYLKGRELFIATRDGTLIFIDVQKGQIIATARASREIDTNVPPCGQENSVLFVTIDGQLWNATLANQAIQLQPFGDTGGLIINALSSNNQLLAIAHGSGISIYDQFGGLLWETGLDGNSIITMPLMNSKLIWIIDDNGVLFFFNLAMSVPKLRVRVFEPTVALPMILTYDRLILSNRLGHLKIYRWS